MIRKERDGPVQSIVLDRAERRNALSEAMIVALGDAIRAAGEDESCRCLVLKGAGDSFCTGRDLGDGAGARDLGSVLARDQVWTDIFHQLYRFSIPTVAVVRGHAVAGGFTLAMGCDFVLAERGAKFGATEMRSDFPAAVNTPVLSRLVGPRLALEMLVFGDSVTAERLYEMGLVNRLADGAEALATIEAEFTARLAALDADAVRLTKELNRAALTMPPDDALQMGNNVTSLIAASGRFDEAVATFARRRKS